MARDAKRAQRAAQKRKEREKRLRMERARRQARAPDLTRRRLLEMAGRLPILECVISRGWRERGLAHILLARVAPDRRLLAAGYYVDLLCLGLKDTAVLHNLDPAEYEQSIKPNVFNDPVELEPCDPGLARAVVEGAIEFAGRFGLKPNKRWSDSRRLLDGIEPAADDIPFGRDGKPCLVLRPGEDVTGPLRRLERVLGSGNFLTERPQDEGT